MNKRFPLYLLTSILVASLSFTSCNDDEETTYVETASSATAVTAFSLQEDDDVLENLDSVFFTIDLDKALIYNADSLPVGTDVSQLKVNMDYVACSSAQFHVTGGEVMNDTTFSYSDSDTLDFTGDVKFTIVSQDLSAKRTYTIKVNVHKIEPDSLYWSTVARRDLPAYTGSPKAQKTVQYGADVYCLIKDVNAYVLAVTSDPAVGNWEKTKIDFGFVPVVNTFTAADNAFYILDENNMLYSSADAKTWNACGVTWRSISGTYEDRLLGVVCEDGVYKHTEYPVSDGFVPYEVDVNFPVSGVSSMVTLSSKWAAGDQRLIIGGVTASGKYTGAVWGYDGAVWGMLSRESIVAAKDVTLVAYPYTYTNSSNQSVKEIPALLAMGGTLQEDSALNGDVYISTDNGITWEVANECLQLPDYIDDFTGAQALVYYSTLSDKSRSSYECWEMMPTPKMPASLRYMNSRATEAVTEWECPYIYLFGGTSLNGTLYNNIWRGAINRLTFKPLY